MSSWKNVRWIVDGVEHVQIEDAVFAPQLLRMRRLLHGHGDNPDVAYATSALYAVSVSSAMNPELESIFNYAYDSIEHMAKHHPTALKIIPSWVEKRNFPLGFKEHSPEEREQCMELFSLLGKALDVCAGASECGSERYTSHYLLDLMAQHEAYDPERWKLYSFMEWEKDRYLREQKETVTVKRLLAAARSGVDYLMAREVHIFLSDIREKMKAVRDGDEVRIRDLVLPPKEIIEFVNELTLSKAFINAVVSSTDCFDTKMFSDIYRVSKEYNLEWAIASHDWEKFVKPWDASIPLVA